MYAAGACTIGIAARSTSTPDVNDVLVSECSSASTNPIYRMQAGAADATRGDFFIRNDVNTVTASNIGKIDTAYDDSDNVLVSIDNGSNIKGYLDGVLDGNDNYTRSGTLTVNRFSLGAMERPTVVGWIPVRVYAVVIYKAALSGADLANLVTYLGSKQGRVL